MNIETTLYIKKDLLFKLDRAATKHHVSRSRMVSILLFRYIKENNAGGCAFISLKYQKRDTRARFETKSLFLREDIYEIWCDVRKAFKLSASFVVARAIERYLADIENDTIIPDNYFGMYIINTAYYNDTCIIQTVWGVPGEKILKKLE